MSDNVYCWSKNGQECVTFLTAQHLQKALPDKHQGRFNSLAVESIQNHLHAHLITLLRCSQNQLWLLCSRLSRELHWNLPTFHYRETHRNSLDFIVWLLLAVMYPPIIAHVISTSAVLYWHMCALFIPEDVYICTWVLWQLHTKATPQTDNKQCKKCCRVCFIAKRGFL